MDEPQEGPGVAGNARGLSENPDRDFDVALSAKIEPSPTGAHQLDARSVNGAAPARGEEVGLSTAAPFASETLGLQSTAQASAQPRVAHSVIIREDDRVAFARGESAAAPDQVSTSQMATISFASFAHRASGAYAGDGASTPGAIALADSDDGTIQLRLGDLIALLEDKMERPLFVWLSSAESASKYVTFDTLRAAGIGVDYDPVHNYIVLSVANGEGK